MENVQGMDVTSQCEGNTMYDSELDFFTVKKSRLLYWQNFNIVCGLDGKSLLVLIF